MIIDFNVQLVDKSACQISLCSELFFPPLSQTLAKLYDGVSLSTKFPELKFDHRFGCPVDIQVCKPNFAIFQAMWTLFNPNSSENARRIFTFDNFVAIEI